MAKILARQIAEFMTLICNLLLGVIKESLGDIFDKINANVIVAQNVVGKLPSEWNGSAYNVVEQLSSNVALPIAGFILTFVLCCELVSMVTDKNSLQDVDTFMFFKYVFKAAIAVFLVSHAFTMSSAVFDVAQFAITKAAALDTTSADALKIDQLTELLQNEQNEINSHSVDIDKMSKEEAKATSDFMLAKLKSYAPVILEVLIVRLGLYFLVIYILIIAYSRMIEIYLYLSMASIPLATVSNREWGNIGTNYAKNLAALGLQGVFIIVCIIIYGVLVQDFAGGASDMKELRDGLFQVLIYSALLAMSISKSHAMAKSIMSANG
ncbi:hypothetical protein AGMMS49975_09140 [Clostridia bacterium]|nr:hypothetical protein AGMMS49975_09140 [Clostridia bacterium]